jgi:hypothetical protein
LSFSTEDSTLYLCRGDNTPALDTYDIWQVEVIPIVDLNSDDIVDADDMCVLVDNWNTENTLCDIAPAPFGDGFVDVQDLIVLSEYLFTDLRIFVDDDAPGDPGPGDPLTSDPLEDGSAEHPFDAIQETINNAVSGETVIVLPGVYIGDGNRDIDFLSKEITVRSTNPKDSHMVASTVIDCQGTQAEQHQGFLFNGSESAKSVLAGLTITNAYANNGGGIVCSSNSRPTITNCILRNNKAITRGGGFYNTGSPLFSNCIFSGNMAENGGALYNVSNARIVNCTFTRNSTTTGGGIQNLGGKLTLTNCILWNNTPAEIRVGGTVSVTYSNIQGGFTGEGNIDADPLFADADDGDYHLKSQAGRYDSITQIWVVDEVTSPCVDAGDPNMLVGDEPEPNGARVNMGAYGGTTEASKSP